jgi:protein-S-isoprenylcysteine O-methyltransferase Ste14
MKILRDILILPVNIAVTIPCVLQLYPSAFFKSTGLIQFTAILMLAAGLSIFIWTVYLFHVSGKGTLALWEPTKKLVISDPYKYTRNPMILSILMILLSESLLFNSFYMLLWFLVFFLITSLYFIFREEPVLLKRFGDDYRKYKNDVPRWFPGLKWYMKTKR